MPVEQTQKASSYGPFWTGIINDKFSKPLVIIALIAASFVLTFMVAREGLIAGLIMLAGIIALPIVYCIVAYPKFGVISLIVVAFVINHLSRFLPEITPLGLVMDVLTYLLILGFFIRQRKERDWSYFNNAISYFVLIWLAYNLLEVINPAAASRLAWVYTVRSVAFIMLMYFVLVYHIRTVKFIRTLIIIWLVFDVIGAISAFQQENIGFFSFENTWLHNDPLRITLLFINGHMRKFGIFSDPVVFAYNMVMGSLICISLIVSNFISRRAKIWLGITTCFFLFVMLYSGTRASYVLLPASLSMLVLLKLNGRVFIAVAIAALFLGALIKVPTSNPALVRFQSAFRPSKDASFNVRAQNQERIKPYILSHPIGGGLGSTGIWGQRFSPNSFLAKFPPDSGYVRVAVETGWFGLLLYCVFNFVILYKGISYYYLIRDPELKCYCLAVVLIIFALDIGNYPQQAFVQYPNNILFYLGMAIINITMRLDLQKRKSEPQNQALLNNIE